MKKVFARALLFAGLILSPLTWWNDPLVNMPLAYLAANACNYLFPGSFFAALLVSYWLTNIIGVLMMLLGAGALLKKKFNKKKGLYWVIAVAVYSAVLTALYLAGAIRPFIYGR